MNQAEGHALSSMGRMDYDKLTEIVSRLAAQYPDTLRVGSIGTTILDRAIPMLVLGNPRASKSILYLGGVSGIDSTASAVLLRFVIDYLEHLKSGRRMYNVNLPYLSERRKLCIIPMLNCDGCTIRRNGCGDSILRDRLLSMNGSENFSNWEANARGVDLCRNFGEGFGQGIDEEGLTENTGAPSGYPGTSPESEPESAALCNYFRMTPETSLVLRLHMKDNRLSYPIIASDGEPIPRAQTVGRLLARLSSLETEKRKDPRGTAEDRYISIRHQPAFALGCKYPDTGDGADDDIKIYAYVKELLFSAPLLV